MGDYDRYGLPELCEMVESDSPETMRSQADGWALLAQSLDDQLTQVHAVKSQLERAWRGAENPQLTVIDDLAAALSEAADIARSNQVAWHGIAHYVEYAQRELTNLSLHWSDAKRAYDSTVDARYVPEGIDVQPTGAPTEEEMRTSYDRAARDIMDLVAAHTGQLAEGLRELPSYVPPVVDSGGGIFPHPAAGEWDAVNGAMPGSDNAGQDEDPRLQYGPGTPPLPGGMGGYGGMPGGMGGAGGVGSGPVLAGPTGGVNPSVAAVAPNPVTPGGYTSHVLGTPAIPAPGKRRAAYISRVPNGAVVRRQPGVMGSAERRRVAIPVEYDVAKLRRRAATPHDSEDDEWKNPPTSSPGIISGANEPQRRTRRWE